MLPGDQTALRSLPWPEAIRALVDDFQAAGWPVLNGSFRYSSLTEGPERVFTCHPGRVWEYASLLQELETLGRPLRILDAGGAGSALPYLLARLGHEVTTTDIQPWLTELCAHIATANGLNLRSITGDLTGASPDLGGPFDVVACVSVLEHIPPDKRAAAIQQLHNLAKPGGIVYLTFDYGEHRHESSANDFNDAVNDLSPIFNAILASGLRFHGNDPRELPETILAQRSTPGFEEIGRSIQRTLRTVDGKTPWRTLLGHVARRLGWRRNEPNRFAHHNFFRMFLERPRNP